MTSVKLKKTPVKMIPIGIIDPPDGHIRLDIPAEEIDELAESIKESGLLSEIEVRRKNSRYEVTYGHRRYLACKQLGIKEVPCKEVDRSDKETKVIRAVENIQRRNLSPIEEAAAYYDLKTETGMSVSQIAKAMKKGPGRVQRYIAIMKFPSKFQRALHEGKVNLGVLEALMTCPDEGKRDYFFELAVEHGITVQIARTWVSEYRHEIERKLSDVSEGGGDYNPLETTPNYIACEICRGPTEQNKVLYLRTCPDCGKEIMAIIRKGE